jgi:hypothetical protein
VFAGAISFSYGMATTWLVSIFFIKGSYPFQFTRLGETHTACLYKKSVVYLDFGNSNNDAYGNYVAVCAWNDVNRDVHQNVHYYKAHDLWMTYLSYSGNN